MLILGDQPSQVLEPLAVKIAPVLSYNDEGVAFHRRPGDQSCNLCYFLASSRGIGSDFELPQQARGGPPRPFGQHPGECALRKELKDLNNILQTDALRAFEPRRINLRVR